jgi:nucleotide-binding universal stress UspA family protein
MVQPSEGQRLKLLVPLDGSHLAEAVLPTVVALAQRCQSQVMLLHVVERHAPTRVHGERHLQSGAEAQLYLEELADRLRQQGILVEQHVHADCEDHVARAIVEHAQELESDLVVICTHGTGGVRDLLSGSIAQQVLQRGTRPVWLVQPRKDGSAPPCALRRILVPLDGTPEHEPALEPAIALARCFGAELHLVFVIPTIATLAGGAAVAGLLLPATMRAVLDLAQHGAEEYLEETVAFCRRQEVVAQAQVLRGDPVSEVVKLATRLEVHLIVLASHGRAGLDALLAGSVAARIVGRSALPLLLVRAAPQSPLQGGGP